MKLSWTWSMGVLLLGALFGGCSSSEPASGTAAPVESPAAPAAAAQPTAEEVVRQMADFYKSKQTLQVNDQATAETRMPGLQNTAKIDRSVAFARPNRLAIRSSGDLGGGMDIICDGQRLIKFMPMLKSYTETAAPESSEEFLSDSGPLAAASGGMFVLSLMSDDPQARLLEGVQSSQYIGRETLDGTDTHHLRFEQEQMDWDLWVDAGDEPLVRQVTLDLSRGMGGIAQQLGQSAAGEISLKITERFADWKFDEPLEADVFAFEPPEDATRQEELFPGMDSGPQAEPPSPLVNKPAPPLELQLVDGSTAKLADHVGRDVVLLDFWATWCPPCRAEMPVLAELVQARAGRGLVLYAINQGEDADTVKRFLEETKLPITVALDPTGESATAFGVEALPTLVLIDRQGIVQAVHVGFAPNLKDSLSAELDKLLADQALVE